MVKYEPIKIGDLSQKDIVIALMGPTGAGMSTFINIATCQDEPTVGHGLQPFTNDFRAVRVAHPRTSRQIVFVDTPGFDDSRKSDYEILKIMVELFRQKNRISLAGIIYLHRISDNRKITNRIPFINLRMFTDLCGEDAIRNVILVTTMWGQVETAIGARREDELRRRFWKSMLDYGSCIARFLDSFESTWEIVDAIVDKSRPVSLSSALEETNIPESQLTVDGAITPGRVQGRRIPAREIIQQDFVIVVFGPAGTGKSSFINTAINGLEVPIGHSLASCTMDIQNVRCRHPRNGSRAIVFVDTPAPGNDTKQDAEIINWMDTTPLRRRSVDGIIYMHRISDLRMTESPIAHVKTFEKLCGTNFARKLVFVTTMWDLVDTQTGERRENELFTKYWGSFIAQGSGMIRFDNTIESAWDAVNLLMAPPARPASGDGLYQAMR